LVIKINNDDSKKIEKKPFDEMMKN